MLLITACDNYTHNSITNTDPANYVNLELTKSFGGTGDDWGEDLYLTPEYDCYIVGETESFGYGASNTYVIKVDINNELQWQKYYGGFGEDVALAVKSADDSCFFILGYTTSFNITTGKKVDPAADPFFKFDDFNFYLIKTNQEGITFWEKPYGTPATDEYGNSLEIVDDGIIMAGYASGATGNNIYLNKTDFDGNLIWSSLIETEGSQIAEAITTCADGNFVLGGSTKATSSADENAYLIKVSSGGDPLWEFTFGLGNMDEGLNSIISTSDGVIGAGYLKVDGDENLNDGILLLLKVDLSGELVWKYSYVTVKGSETSCLEQSSNGDFIVVTNNFATDETTFSKFDSDGQLLWTQKKGKGAGRSIKHRPNDPSDRYIMTGLSSNPSFTTNVNASYIIVSEDLTNIEL